MMATDHSPFNRPPDGIDGNGPYYLVELQSATDAMEFMYAYWLARRTGFVPIGPVPYELLDGMLAVIDEGFKTPPPDPLPEKTIFRKVRRENLEKHIEDICSHMRPNAEVMERTSDNATGTCVVCGALVWDQDGNLCENHRGTNLCYCCGEAKRHLVMVDDDERYVGSIYVCQECYDEGKHLQ